MRTQFSRVVTPILTAVVCVVMASTRLAVVKAQERSHAPVTNAPHFEPGLGALKLAAEWANSTFIVFNADGETVKAIPPTIAIPYGTAQSSSRAKDYSPQGSWLELPPGTYVVWAGAPGKRAMRRTVEVVPDKERLIWVHLSNREGKWQVSNLTAKTGRHWGKP